MDKILETAFGAEQKAQHIMDIARKTHKQCERNIKNAENIKQEYLQIAKENIENFKTAKKSELESEIQKLEKELKSNLKKMHDCFEKDSDKWVDKMFADITETV